MTTDIQVTAAATPPYTTTAQTTATTPAAPVTQQPTGTIAGGAVQDKPVTTPATWPDNWRDLMAAGDEKFRKQLDRVTDPSVFAKNYRELESKKGAGLLVQKLSDNPTPEELSAYRQANGIPETPDKYDTTLPNGLVVGDADKELVGGFLKAMHEKNASPEQVKHALAWYYQQQDEQIANQAKHDYTQRVQAEESLRQEWGNEFKMRVDSVSDFLVKTFGPEQAQNLQMARLSDGSVLGNNPAILKALAQVAHEINPAHTVVPGAANQGQAIESELQTIQRTMRDEPQKYWSDPSMQKRLGELLEAQQRMKARG